MGLLNIGVGALRANQLGLQTAGHNIANANTPGYSRQRIIQESITGQFTGAGYVGKGVNVETIQRNFDNFLNRQATLTSATQSGDVTRANYLKQLSNIFPGGTTGLGASINSMLNSFSDVASAPTDLTARQVALTQVDETARRMRAASQSIDDLQAGITNSITEKVNNINTLAQNIADINQQIAKANGTGQPPNDLLDKRDELIKNLNQYVQTSSIAADDGTVGVFIASSQALVLGTRVAPLTVGHGDFNDLQKTTISIQQATSSVPLDENLLGGGEVSALIRFQNTDLVEGRNLLGRITTAVSSTINAQHKLGLDLDGKVGGNLFTPPVFTAGNVLSPVPPAKANAGTSSLTLSIADASKFEAANYEVNFSSATAGTITRSSDGVVTNFDFATSNPVVIDGLNITKSAVGTAVAGDRFLLKPFSSVASNVAAEFSTPRSLAVASPVVGAMGSTNTGSLKLQSLVARSNPLTNVPVKITFTSSSTYTRSDDVPANATSYSYTSGKTIEGTSPTSTPLSQWSLTIQGVPSAGDTFTVSDIKDPSIKVDYKLNSGNATAMMALRDVPMFGGAALTDGYAGMIAQIGIRSQSANYTADVSTNMATNAEAANTGVSGVNLDEEAAQLLQYQQAYQASAKMIQIAQAIFDNLIQSFR